MFDKTVINKTSKQPVNQTVTHNYASTASDAAKLKEMEEAVLKKITKSMAFELENIGVVCKSIEISVSPYERAKEVYILYKLNSEEKSMRVKYEEFTSDPIYVIAQTISKQISDKIMEEIHHKLLELKARS